MKEHSENGNTVVYMTDPEAKFVSLVKRGANRTPFRIVKQQKEQGMKIIQRIVAKKGTDVAVIKSAVGDEAAGALNLSEPKDAGAFTLYDQHPEHAFKADTMQVVSLSEDNSVICLCGEMAEKSDSFVSKLLSRKSETKGVEVPDSMQPMDAEVLKSSLADSLWTELDALGNGIHNILCQSEGKAGEKVKMCRTLCDNFISCLETVVSTMKSDDFVLAEPKQPEPTEKSDTEGTAEVAEKADSVEPSEKHEGVAEPAEKADEAKKGEDTEQEAPASAATAFEAKLDKLMSLLEGVEKSSKEENAALKKAVEDITERVSKMEKAPASPVSAHEDSGGAEGVAKSQEPENVFAGLFGDLHR